MCSFHLNDFVFQEGQWLWENSGVPLENGYTNWQSGEPNNYDGNQDCLNIVKGGKWYDLNCDLNGYEKPLCQIDA